MNKKQFSVLFLIFLFAVSSHACGSYENSFGDNDLQVIHDKTFKIEPGKKLKLSGSMGDVLLTAWDRSEVQVKVLGNKKAKDKIDFKFNAGNDLIEVIAKRKASHYGVRV